jgi:hypothetical protein
LIRIWVSKYEEGAFDADAQAADLIQEYEARIAALVSALREESGSTCATSSDTR